MSSLTAKDKLLLEKLLQMSHGYVLDFSDRTMSEFFSGNLGVDIYSEQFDYQSGSKANRMRRFWMVVDDEDVGQSILLLIDYIESKILLGEFTAEQFKQELMSECRKIGQRLAVDPGSANAHSELDERLQEFLLEDFEGVEDSIRSLGGDIEIVLMQRLSEISAILTTAPLAAVVLIGSTLEGVLLDVAFKNATEFVGASAAPTKDGTVRPLPEWRLNDLINVAFELSYVTKNVKDFSQVVRGFRNYIHPRAQARAGFNPDAHTARICFQVLRAALNEIDER
jgi:hypothetical protein